MDGRGRRRAGAALSTDRQQVRAAAKRRRARRGAAISAASTVAVLGGLTALVVTSPGWHDVRTTFFDPGDFADAFPDVAKGFWLDIKLFVIVELAVLLLGLVVALVRTTRTPALFPLRLIAAVFCDVTMMAASPPRTTSVEMAEIAIPRWVRRRLAAARTCWRVALSSAPERRPQRPSTASRAS